MTLFLYPEIAELSKVNYDIDIRYIGILINKHTYI